MILWWVLINLSTSSFVSEVEKHKSSSITLLLNIINDWEHLALEKNITHTHPRARTHIHAHTHTHTRARAHTHTYTRPHTYMTTYMKRSSWPSDAVTLMMECFHFRLSILFLILVSRSSITVSMRMRLSCYLARVVMTSPDLCHPLLSKNMWQRIKYILGQVSRHQILPYWNSFLAILLIVNLLNFILPAELSIISSSSSTSNKKY